MGYRISLVVNTLLSLLFIFISLYAVVIENDFSTTSLSIAGTLFIMSTIFLWFDIICFKVNKVNKELSFISKRLKNTGNVIFVFTLLTVLAVIFFTVLAFIEFPDSDTSSSKFRVIIFAITLFIFLLTAVTGVMNLIFFRKALRKNKAVVNQFINDIGN